MKNEERIINNILKQLDGLSYVSATLVLEQADRKIGNVSKVTLSEVDPEQSDRLSDILPQDFQEHQAD